MSELSNTNSNFLLNKSSHVLEKPHSLNALIKFDDYNDEKHDDKHEEKLKNENVKINEYGSRVAKAKLFIQSKIQEYGLSTQGWKWNFSNRLTSAAGNCNYKKKIIKISTVYISKATEFEINDTILHEIAHALTPGHKHDNVWMSKAKSIGCSGSVCHEVKMKTFEWLLRCPYGCSSNPVLTKRKKCKYVCPVCDQLLSIVPVSEFIGKIKG